MFYFPSFMFKSEVMKTAYWVSIVAAAISKYDLESRDNENIILDWKITRHC